MNKKYSCEPNANKIINNTLFENKSVYDNDFVEKLSNAQIVEQIAPIAPQMLSKNIKESDIECKYCNKTFSKRSNLVRHINKNQCSIKKVEEQKINDKDKEIIDLKNRLEQLELLIGTKIKGNAIKNNVNNNSNNTINNITNNTNNTNNTINSTNNIVNIVAFGKEDLSIFSDEQCTAFLKRGFNSVGEFIKSLHFDENKPQFNSIYISNLNNGKYACVYDGVKWIKCLRETAIEDLKDKGIDFLSAKYNELTKNGKLTEQHKKSLQTFIDFTEDRDGFTSQQKTNNQFEKNMSEGLELILYNEAHIVKKLIKK
jgi:hypothetical protein